MDKIDKKLRAYQQAELNAMVAYRGLAERYEEGKRRDLLQSVAAQEGRHAAVFRGLTCVHLKCKNGLKRAFVVLHFLLKDDLTLRVLAFGEKKAGKGYERFVQKYDINELTSIAQDEYEHAERLLASARDKNEKKK